MVNLLSSLFCRTNLRRCTRLLIDICFVRPKSQFLCSLLLLRLSSSLILLSEPPFQLNHSKPGYKVTKVREWFHVFCKNHETVRLQNKDRRLCEPSHIFPSLSSIFAILSTPHLLIHSSVSSRSTLRRICPPLSDVLFLWNRTNPFLHPSLGLSLIYQKFLPAVLSLVT